MTAAGEVLEAARSAYERKDWKVARDLFRSLGDDLPSDDLSALADCSWWLGDMAETNRLWEILHHRFQEEGRPEDAARAAMELAVNHFLRGDEALGSGWLGRALRLAEDIPHGPIHGYLTYVVEVEANWRSTDIDDVMQAAAKVRDIGMRHGDPTLVAVSLNGEGRLLAERGNVPKGMALIDEAMVSVLAGEVAPDWAGNIYCNTIAVCHKVGDLRRMARWTEATEAWLETMPAAVVFDGICRVHRTQLLALRGDWDRAEQQALRVAEELAGIMVSTVAEAWYQAGEIRRLRGNKTGAEEAYRLAHETGRHPQPGLSLLRLAEGKSDIAAAAVRAALAATEDPLRRADLCAASVEILLASGDIESARKACEELSSTAAVYATSGLEAMSVTALGAVTLAEGTPHEALPPLREAYTRWRNLEAPHHAARVCILLAEAYRSLGDEEASAAELELAGATFERLGALADAAAVAAMRGEAPRPGGLTEREIEVLGLVAEGRSNREIGEELFISQKTVARHLSNIFTKLGVASRTEAAKFAFEAGLSDPR
jgi:DNA-binding NarL/FixJ family response regulator